MPAVEPPVLTSESGFVKMEDRKRPAAENNESAPPLKKQATTVNGGSKPHPDADMPWKDDLEVSSKISGLFLTPLQRLRLAQGPCSRDMILTGLL
jgi:hypothetical protein